MLDLTLRCPECGRRADMCFEHGDDWKKRDKTPKPCPHCGLPIVQTGDGRFPCSFCGGELRSDA